MQTLSLDRPAGAEAVEAPARIGPNAVIQLAAALRAAGLNRLAVSAFGAAGAGEWLATPPDSMVEETRVARIHQAVRAALPQAEAFAVMTEAGRLTANYLLANRIPRAAQRVLKLLPARLASAALVPAIQAHAWTFAGSGQFTAEAGKPTVFELRHNPLCAGETAAEPACDWHAAVFQRLFQVLVSPRARVTETHCEARGDDCCRFVIDW